MNNIRSSFKPGGLKGKSWNKGIGLANGIHYFSMLQQPIRSCTCSKQANQVMHSFETTNQIVYSSGATNQIVHSFEATNQIVHSFESANQIVNSNVGPVDLIVSTQSVNTNANTVTTNSCDGARTSGHWQPYPART